MLNFIKILFILLLLLSNQAFSLSSSAYLVSNTAIKSFDFERAKLEFDKPYVNLNETDLHNQLLTYISLNLLNESRSIAVKILAINEFNQEAWAAYLINSLINNNLSAFELYNKNQNKSELKLVNYIFFSNNNQIKKNKVIAESIFEIIQASIKENDDQIDYKFLLFYLSLITILDPSFNEAYFYSAQIYEIIENYTKAEFFYSKIPLKHTLYLNSQINIAINKNKRGFKKEGISLLINLLDNDKKNLDLIIAIADTYRVQKNYIQSIKYYTKIIESQNNFFNEYWRIYYLRGICFERLNNWNFAEKDFLKSLKIKPNSPEVLNYLAYGWLERGQNLSEATNMLKEAYKRNPNSFYIADSLAWAFYKNKKFLKAVNLMEKVVSMAPGEAVSLDHLGDIYFSMNRKREAYFYWKQALDLAEPEDEISNNLIEKLKVYDEG